MNTQQNTQVVYKQVYAAKLIKMGHKIKEMLPNPRFPQRDMWLFEVDDTFYEDFEKIRGGNQNG